jgi:hypothetical protein
MVHHYGVWVHKQNGLYNLVNKLMKENNYASLDNFGDEHKKVVECMKNQEVYDLWFGFKGSDMYIKHFMNTVDSWYYEAGKLKAYVDKNGRFPPDPKTVKDDVELKKLGYWVGNQRRKKAGDDMQEEWRKFIVDNGYEKFCKV